MFILGNMQRSADEGVKILFGGTAPHTVFELVGENTLKVIAYDWGHRNINIFEAVDYLLWGRPHSNDPILNDFASQFPTLREHFRWVEFREKTELQLSTEQAEDIRHLIENVVRGGSDGRFEGRHPMDGDPELNNHVLAIIDGETYWSWITPSISGHFNEDLWSLADKLIELTPADLKLRQHLDFFVWD